MSSAKITLIGMNQYDEHLFDNMMLPPGIDKDLFIDTLILKAGEFEVLYPQPNFMKAAIGAWSHKWFRTFSEWLRGTQSTWNPIENYDRYEDSKDTHNKKFGSETSADYTSARLANLTDKRTADLTDRETVDFRDNRTVDLQDRLTRDMNSRRNVDLNDHHSVNFEDNTHDKGKVDHIYDSSQEVEQMESGQTEHQTSAFDSTSYRNDYRDTTDAGMVETRHDGKDTDDHDGTIKVERDGFEDMDHTGYENTRDSGSDTTVHTGTDSTGHTGNDVKHLSGTDTNTTTGTDETRTSGKLSDLSGSEDSTINHTSHIHGNIGVTQASDMLRAFYDISAWNLYDHMSDMFTRELLIPVY